MYQGIDMKFYGNNLQMEYDIIVNPGASPSRIQFSYDGIEDLRVTEEGDLEICLKEGKLLQKRPYIYQEIGGKRVEVEGRLRVSGLELRVQNTRQFVYGFQVASYDKRYPLVIDPILVYSTYLGGSGDDDGWGIAVDADGNAYITGSTESTDFPTTNALNEGLNRGSDAFVTKMNAAGTSLIYSTYLDGWDLDESSGIAVDAARNAYIAGVTYSGDFPTANAFDESLNGETDAFVTKIASYEQPLYKAKWIKVSPAHMIRIKRGENSTITVILTSKGGYPVEGQIVEAFIQGGKKHKSIISVSPASQTTDTSGQAVFTVHANQVSTAKVIFRTDGVRKKAFARVHVKFRK
jgi:hypothetical protein